MTRDDDILRMAREAGMTGLSLIDVGYLERFAALVAAEVGIAQWHRGFAEGQAAEREQCARIADAELAMFGPDAPVTQYQSGIFTAAEHIAQAIRAMSHT